jgi:hypothetical protein
VVLTGLIWFNFRSADFVATSEYAVLSKFPDCEFVQEENQVKLKTFYITLFNEDYP